MASASKPLGSPRRHERECGRCDVEEIDSSLTRLAVDGLVDGVNRFGNEGWPLKSIAHVWPLVGANLKGANLSGANLSGANLSGANLTGANLSDVTWGNTTCPDGTNSDNDGGTCLGHL